MNYDSWKLDNPYNHEKHYNCTCKVCGLVADSDEFVEEDICSNCSNLLSIAKKLEGFVTDTLCSIERMIECEWTEFAGFNSKNLPVFVIKVNNDIFEILTLNSNGKFDLSFVNQFEYNKELLLEANQGFFVNDIDLDQYKSYSKIRFNIQYVYCGPAMAS